MNSTSQSRQFAPLRVFRSEPLLVAGLRDRFTETTRDKIPALWQRLAPHLGRIPGQVDRAAYGISFCADDPTGFDYLAGVVVSSFAGLPPDWSQVKIPALRYAVFPHEGHVSEIFRTAEGIEQWLPQSGYHCVGAPDGVPMLIERYGERFNPATGTGDIELWAPIAD